MIFAKEQGDDLASLVKQIDDLVAKNAKKQLRSLVNFIGEDRNDLEESAAKFGKAYKNVAIVVPVEYSSGPKNFGVNPDAGVTVLIYRRYKVVANHATLPGKLSKSGTKRIKRPSCIWPFYWRKLMSRRNELGDKLLYRTHAGYELRVRETR